MTAQLSVLVRHAGALLRHAAAALVGAGGRAYEYLANWATHRIMLRLPLSLLDPDDVEDYCVGDHVHAWATDNSVVLDLTSDDEPGDGETPEGTLSVIIGVRDELADGDLRPLYLAWLAGYGTWERDEDAFDYDDEREHEPPVPSGLATLTGPQRALADFLRLDDDLLRQAAPARRPDQGRRLACRPCEPPGHDMAEDDHAYTPRAGRAPRRNPNELWRYRYDRSYVS